MRDVQIFDKITLEKIVQVGSTLSSILLVLGQALAPAGKLYYMPGIWLCVMFASFLTVAVAVVCRLVSTFQKSTGKMT